jgi:hypothetical protein
MDSYDKSNIPTDEYIKIYDKLYKFFKRRPRKLELERELDEYNRRKSGVSNKPK